MEAFGLSRSRDKKGKVVNRSLKPWVNCIHTLVGGDISNAVTSVSKDSLIIQIDEEIKV